MNFRETVSQFAPEPAGALAMPGQELIGQLPLPLAILDVESRYVSVSPAFAFALGRKATDLVGHRHGEIVQGFPKDWEEVFESVLRTGASRKGEEDHFVKPGRGRPGLLRWEAHSLKANEGGTTGLLLILEVLTRRKRFELLARRSAKNETIAQLCQTLGTNLRNLFTVLDGHAEKLFTCNGVGANESPRSAAEKGLRLGISQGLEVSDGLDALGRNRALSPRLTDLGEVLREAASGIRAKAPENINVSFVAKEGNWHCLVDETQLMKTVMTLFKGLGLSVAYGFVTHSNGDLRIVSSPGEGTKVYVSLPFHDWAWKG